MNKEGEKEEGYAQDRLILRLSEHTIVTIKEALAQRNGIHQLFSPGIPRQVIRVD